MPDDGKGSSSGAFSVTGSTSSVVSRLLAFICSVYTFAKGATMRLLLSPGAIEATSHQDSSLVQRCDGAAAAADASFELTACTRIPP